MLFFKSKPKNDEILPPPPPFPSLEFESLDQKPEEDEVISQGDFNDLFKEEKEFEKFPRIEQEIPKKELKTEKAQPIKEKVKPGKEEVPEIPNLEDYSLDDVDFKIPEEFENKEENVFPQPLELFDDEKASRQKPKEILEAEDEIKSAVENIKKQDKPSFLRKLFGRKEERKEPKKEEPLKQIMSDLSDENIDNTTVIRNNIDRAREALMNFDLETAKTCYVVCIKIYNSLAPEEQAKVYHDIKDLYFERKSAEQMKV